MESKLKRTIAILLTVLFLVSITATAVSAVEPAGRLNINSPNMTVFILIGIGILLSITEKLSKK